MGLGKEWKFWALPEEMPGKGEKKGEGERGLESSPLIPSLCTYRVREGEGAAKPCSAVECGTLVDCHRTCV